MGIRWINKFWNNGIYSFGGLAAVLVSVPPVEEAWKAGGLNMFLCAFIIFSYDIYYSFNVKKFNKSKKEIILLQQ